MGHFAKLCPLKSNVSKAGNLKKNVNHKFDGDAFVCTEINGLHELDVWLADSGASTHMFIWETMMLLRHMTKERLGFK